MSLSKNLAPMLLLTMCLPILTYASSSSSSSVGGGKENKRTPPIAAKQSDGERKFAQNCGRCHNPPEGFSPHISGTIVRHMRARAALSKQDEEEILHFLNP
jgi:cytochrome c2